ncbi:hypothetical protein ACFWZ2_38535 [Streptomyces sp. NPDC059002]|uniref:hypothetical protein n=1 Tax=Streptomyces sp. NPDC059002 TaxID=3346690 RepID=UPI00368666A3
MSHEARAVDITGRLGICVLHKSDCFNGWSFGGALGFSGKGGSLGFEGSYSYSVSNTEEYGISGNFGQTGEIPARHWGRFDIHEITGVYDGHLFLSLRWCPRDNAGWAFHTVNRKISKTTSRLIIFPVHAAVVKPPGAHSGYIRFLRAWENGTPAPD